MKRTLLFALMLILVALAMPTYAANTTVDESRSFVFEDAYVRGNDLGGSFGGNPNLIVRSAGTDTFVSYTKVNIANVSLTVQAAAYRHYWESFDSPDASFNHVIWFANWSDWVEGSTTFNNQPCNAGSGNRTVPISRDGCQVIAVFNESMTTFTSDTNYSMVFNAEGVAAVEAERVSNDGIFTLIHELTPRGSGTTRTLRFASTETSTPAVRRPMMVLDTAAAIAPPTITITNPVTNQIQARNNLTVDYSITVDPTTHNAGVVIYVNNTKNVTTASNTTVFIPALADGVYNIIAEITDGLGAAVNSTVVDNVRLDTVNPFDDLLVQIPSGSVYSDFTSITVTASNVNLENHTVTVVNTATGASLFSQTDVNIAMPNNAINFDIDNAYGVGSFTVTSNETDVANNNASSVSTFSTIAPTIQSVLCAFNDEDAPTDEYVACDTQLTTDGLTDFELITINATSGLCTFDVITNATVLQLDDGAMSNTNNVHDAGIFNNITIESVVLFNATFTCNNEFGTAPLFSETWFTSLPIVQLGIAAGATLQGFDGTNYAEFMITVVILFVVSGLLFSQVRKPK